MSGILETKKKIIASLKVKPKTITDLSNELNLSLPTVQEHLEDLIDAGAIENIESHGKWKYYKLNPKFDTEEYTTPRLLRRKKLGYLALILIVIIAITGFAFYSVQKSELSISCSTNSIYTCSNPKFSSGVLSLNISGFTKPTLIRSFGCSYNSSQPTNFTSINLFVYPNESAKLNLTCTNSNSISHIYIVYSINGTNSTILLNVSKGASIGNRQSASSTISSIPSISTISTVLTSTTIKSSTISISSSSVSTSLIITTMSTVQTTTILSNMTQNSTTTSTDSSSISSSLRNTTSILDTTISMTTSIYNTTSTVASTIVSTTGSTTESTTSLHNTTSSFGTTTIK